ncbi:MAG TPA: nuclear transport factor 2 family protein [Gordonia sp. (in: high G+C Gram-positive bacteria)]|uniref:nuclear transport factor 2 family protein n=1 Tax=unclassified Gordonia (in: high G+C Gram-positive bacteria) TaxID=2657482 RepID=UPI000FAFC580|nr:MULTISPECIES: nuclear transport factor 2 family protein [unclassified Gordonia (in: high G+C Gram-positive bacteria)]RUP40080.1 MAG: nuclear transport factor 2 family protein [Gordonia sp. (in: high G+C Gram-positive bacteria)]HNP57198.1 nuclear transport factor 2 family protein [Gordonia sp. (in: high G+C Gram-positive bacteria)]HRC50174.1 nuclear transport factor 2 family protein [Gordonia sp. (in: high G+C Gram-positive bacteria)]
MTEISASTSFGPFDRAELEEMKDRWLAANIEAEKIGDWRGLADYYAVDATYGWNYGPTKDFMAVGRDEIRDLALGQEMEGLNGWIYPYQTWVIDEKTGDMIGLWKQVYEGTREDGTNYALEGIQGSWFKYGGNFEFAWQRDFFDYGNVSALFIEMLTKKAMSDEMLARVEKSAPGNLPGWYDFGTAPVKFW